MTLQEYLDAKDLTPIQFAAQVGVTDESIRRYVRGVRLPSPEMMRRIARKTRGEVMPNDFLWPHGLPSSIKTCGASQ